MEILVQECLNHAKNLGYAAQIFVHRAQGVGYTYKNLTDETIIQNESENRLILTIEKNGQKASRKYVIESNMAADRMVAEVAELLHFASPDAAESLPDITGQLEKNVAQFAASDLDGWAKLQFERALKSLKNSNYDIESLTVGGNITTIAFANTFGASKSSTTGGTSISIGLSGSK